MRNLLTFLDSEDRARALERYEELFAAAGPEGEESLIASFGSPVRQVLVLEKEYRQAEKDGAVPFLKPMPMPEGFAPRVTVPPAEVSVTAPEGEVSNPPARDDSFVRAAADVLEEQPSASDTWEAISSMDEEFPLESLIPPGEPTLKTAASVFPEVVFGLPEEDKAEDMIPDIEEPAMEETLPETQSEAGEESRRLAAETPDEPLSAQPESIPAGEIPEEEPPAEGEGAPDPEMTEDNAQMPLRPDAPAAESVSAPDDLPEDEPVVPVSSPEIEPAAEPTADAAEKGPESKTATVRKAARYSDTKRHASPGAARIFAAIVVTFPFIVLWLVSFAVSVALGLAVMAVGFACCAAGVYLAGYVFHAGLSFMPDRLLIGGGALVTFALALLFLWMGLWIAVGGFGSVIRWTGSVYRRILRKKVPRKGEGQ